MADGDQQQPQQPAQVPATRPAAPQGLDSINLQGGGGFMPTFRNFDEVYRWCDMVSRSTLVPKAYKDKPGDIMVAVQFGTEIGLKGLQSLQSIAVINGTPSIYGDAALALVRSSGMLEDFDEWIEVDGVRQVGAVDIISLDGKGKQIVQYCMSKRKGMKARTTAFSVADAKQAKLWMKKNKNQWGESDSPWVTSPQRMLMFRARSWNLRDNFGDVIKGLPLYEEALDFDTHAERPPAEVIEERSQPGTKGAEAVEKLDRAMEERNLTPPASPQPPASQPVSTTEQGALQNETAPPAQVAAQAPYMPPDIKGPGDMDAAVLVEQIKAAEDALKATVDGKKKYQAVLGAMRIRLVGTQIPIQILPAEKREEYLASLQRAIEALKKR